MEAASTTPAIRRATNVRPTTQTSISKFIFTSWVPSSSEDVYVIGKDFPRIAEIQLHTSDDGQWLLATVANGDGGQFADYLMNSSGQWKQVTHFEDAIVSAKLGTNGDAALYLLSRKDAPRGKVFRLPLADPTLAKAAAHRSAKLGSRCGRHRSRLDRCNRAGGHAISMCATWSADHRASASLITRVMKPARCPRRPCLR